RDNRIVFRYRHVREPDGPDDDRRRLAVAFYRLELAGGSRQAGSPRADAERGTLFLPYGSQLAYVVRLEPQTELRVKRLAFRGSSGHLDVWLETDTAEPRRMARLEKGGQGGAVGLPVDEPTPGRLVLRALAEGTAEREAGVLLEEPELWSGDPVQQAAAWRAPEPDGPRRPHIVLYLVDTLRSDRLGVYGYERPLTPRLDEFAREAVVFERAVGQSSWTRASIASIFTGLWPHTHGAIGRRDRLSEEAVTLAEALAAGGYHTVAFATNPNIDERFGFSQGFEEYYHVRRGTDSPRVTARVLQWLDQWEDDGRPLFLFVHTVDPHDPYTPPPEFMERFAPESKEYLEERAAQRRRDRWSTTEENLWHMNRLYDAEVAFNDASFGVFLDELRERALYDDSILAFVSDHGEEFQEHGNFTHGKNLFAETLDFPFVIRFPGQREGRRVATPVQHTDLMPTLLDYLGLPIPDAVEGRSLAAVADPRFEEPAGSGARIFSHLELDGSLILSVVDGDWKMIEWHARRGPHRALFNLREDPGETVNLADRYPIRTAVMARMLTERLEGGGARLRREEAELDEELERSLKALGYLQ
ncbi:MAG: sulfatase, partial [Thermoanaerobaculia bacterium]|nr:sulfatase [Thermoanaerobaculia bacterium]